MVLLLINPKKGNHAKFFPHSGYLGLSNVNLSGTVSTLLEEDRSPIEACKLVVRIRCYESIGSHTSAARPDPSVSPSLHPSLSNNVKVLWQTEKTLWSTTTQQHHTPSTCHDETYEPIGDSIHPWRLSIPPHAVEPTMGGHAIGSTTYKTWRVWWLVEAVLYHKPMGISGQKIIKSFPLYLPNYSRSKSQLSTTHLHSTSSRLSYSLSAPASLSCGDEAVIGFSIGISNDQEASSSNEPLTLKAVSVSLVRTLATETISVPSDPPEGKRWKLRRITLSPPTPRPYPSRQTSTVNSTIVEADLETRGRPVVLNSVSNYQGTLTLRLPEPKSRYHYSIGESCKTTLASVDFSFICKVIVKTKSGGLETLYLNPLQVHVSSVSRRELTLALGHLKPVVSLRRRISTSSLPLTLITSPSHKPLALEAIASD